MEHRDHTTRTSSGEMLRNGAHASSDQIAAAAESSESWRLDVRLSGCSPISWHCALHYYITYICAYVQSSAAPPARSSAPHRQHKERAAPRRTANTQRARAATAPPTQNRSSAPPRRTTVRGERRTAARIER